MACFLLYAESAPHKNRHVCKRGTVWEATSRMGKKKGEGDGGVNVIKVHYMQV
jgi:hypothetical protein